MPHPLFVVRWVSRRFRMIASELDFWNMRTYDDIAGDLQILNLPPIVQAGCIRNLLLDDALVRRLIRRKGWYFSSVDVFYAVVTGAPEVFQHTERLKFVNFADGLNLAVDRSVTIFKRRGTARFHDSTYYVLSLCLNYRYPQIRGMEIGLNVKNRAYRDSHWISRRR